MINFFFPQSPKQKQKHVHESLFFTILSPSNLSPSPSQITDSPYPSTITVESLSVAVSDHYSPVTSPIADSPSPITVTVIFHNRASRTTFRSNGTISSSQTNRSNGASLHIQLSDLTETIPSTSLIACSIFPSCVILLN